MKKVIYPEGDMDHQEYMEVVNQRKMNFIKLEYRINNFVRLAICFGILLNVFVMLISLQESWWIGFALLYADGCMLYGLDTCRKTEENITERKYDLIMDNI